MKKICYVATIPAVVNSFLRPHIQAAAKKYEVTVICNSVDKFLLEGLNARLIFLNIRRKPAPLRDLLVLCQLTILFYRERFDVVHTHMPKTGLLGMMAAWITSVPIRINTSHGEVWANRNGWKRFVLKMFDRLVGLIATENLLVSPSQRNFLLQEGVLRERNAKVIGAGSICGIDVKRFCPNVEVRRDIRDALNISQDARLILFVGRLTRDKGVLDLALAFEAIANLRTDVVLLMVGTEEDVPFKDIQNICKVGYKRLHYQNFSPMPEKYMCAADVFCLPSYREGFGLTLIEAAGCGIPAVASRIYGITDAVKDNETGILFPAGDVVELQDALLKLVSDDELRKSMGLAARKRAVFQFSSEKIIEGMMSFYALSINKNGER